MWKETSTAVRDRVKNCTIFLKRGANSVVAGGGYFTQECASSCTDTSATQVNSTFMYKKEQHNIKLFALVVILLCDFFHSMHTYKMAIMFDKKCRTLII